MLFQLIAMHIPPEKMQIVTFNPGSVYGSGWKVMGFPKERFDTGKTIPFPFHLECLLIVLLTHVDELCGAYAVWAASKEAEFLHGRMTWASWDVEEMATGAIRKRIDSDPEFLRASIVGANSSV
jgi:hypothetical protein